MKFEVYTPVTYIGNVFPTLADAIHAARRLQAYGFEAYLVIATYRFFDNDTTVDYDEVTWKFNPNSKIACTAKKSGTFKNGCHTRYIRDGHHVN